MSGSVHWVSPETEFLSFPLYSLGELLSSILPAQTDPLCTTTNFCQHFLDGNHLHTLTLVGILDPQHPHSFRRTGMVKLPGHYITQPDYERRWRKEAGHNRVHAR